ncbi:unnamed protein product [Urochloa decumbens]|uniref:Uncharacterized protein n=1 Tax=Urochloa decumbens TaxID=240449 RepID=A0ABC9GZ15_9POAL
MMVVHIMMLNHSCFNTLEWNFLLLMQPCIGGPSVEVTAMSFEGGEGSMLGGSICFQ